MKKKSYAVAVRYQIRYTIDGVTWASLTGKNRSVVYFEDESAARNYLHKCIDHIPGIRGVFVYYERYTKAI